MPGAVYAALASAFCFAMAAALQHREALKVHVSGVADLRLLWRLGRRPLWVAGVACDVASMALHVLALSMATLALVQPLGVTGIVFVIPLAALLDKKRIRLLDIAAAAAVVAGLIVILRLIPTSVNVGVPSAGWLLLTGFTAAVVLIIAVAGGHFAPGRPRALLLAGAAGTAFGLTAVLVRALLLLAQAGSFSPAVVVAALWIVLLGLAGYLTMQHAYRAGHFAGSLATATVIDPLVAVLAGHVLLHESLPADPVRLAAIGTACLLVCAGVGLLVRSPAAVSLAVVPLDQEMDLGQAQGPRGAPEERERRPQPPLLVAPSTKRK